MLLHPLGRPLAGDLVARAVAQTGQLDASGQSKPYGAAAAITILSTMSSLPSPLRAPLLSAAAMTGWVTFLAYAAPPEYAGTLVGLSFFGATYLLVLRKDAAAIATHGLALGGIFESVPLNPSRMLRDCLSALGGCAGAGLVFFPAYVVAYMWWFKVAWPPALDFGGTPLDDLLGQVLAIALPEEMFYRGYLQRELERSWPPTYRLFGARVGLALVVSSAIFALGHFTTTPHPSRLAVFFPSLAFGWLLNRSRGIGAPVFFHAACNLLSAALARGSGFIS